MNPQHAYTLRKQSFAQDLLNWFALAAREMPWRESRDPYRIWVSEIMLQQTQVNTVRPYFERFIKAFPSVRELALAPLERVLKLWEGLGYYSRARNLHKGANYVLEHFQGQIPRSPAEIRKIPGIGPYSAGAILSIAFDLPEPAVDGNVIRVFSRLDAINQPFDTVASRRQLEERVRGLIPAQAGDFNQALMELGALICTPAKPRCSECPVQSHCKAFSQGNPETYPLKVKKTRVRLLQMAVALIRRGDQYLFQQQGEQGIFRQLWCFPGLELSAVELSPLGELGRVNEALQAVLPLKIELQGHLGVVSHTLTHRQLEMSLYLAQAQELSEQLPSGWVWLDPRHNPDYAIPVAHQKIISYLQAHPLLLEMFS